MGYEFCAECGGWLDRPAPERCKDPRHPRPTLAQRIVRAIERDLDGRSGMEWFGYIDEETRYSIRDAWAALVEKELDRNEEPAPPPP